MRVNSTSPVVDVTFGQALKISLDNYYDLLKASVGGLKANEYLQLKLVADPVDISDDDAAKKGYRWWSFYNLVVRSDVAIIPEAVSNQIATGAATLAEVYSEYLDLLITYVVENKLTPQDVQALSDLTVELRSLRDDNFKLAEDDQARWRKYADLQGYAYGDWTHYSQWASHNGNWSDIKENNAQIDSRLTHKKKILNTQWADPEDKAIVAASAAFDNALMQLAYPIHPDYLYSDGSQFDLNYLSRLAGDDSGSGLFDSRRALSWQLTLNKILTTTAGHFDASFDHTTGKSTSISTDWHASGSVSYGFISAHADASSHTAIQEDFNKGQTMKLHAEAAYRLDIIYPGWFRPTIFDVKHVKDNPKAFDKYFGTKGLLRFYPTALMLVRGFSVEFTSSQDWAYDYQHSFSASAGGGFSCCGINFGAEAGYSENTKEHQVDQSHTSLKFSDDANTLRFIGYAVAENAFFDAAREASIGDALVVAMDKNGEVRMQPAGAVSSGGGVSADSETEM